MASALIVHSANPDGKKIANALVDGLQKNGLEVAAQPANKFQEVEADLYFLISTHTFFALDDAAFKIAESGVLKGKRTAAIVIDAGLGKKALDKLVRVLTEKNANIISSLLLHKVGAVRSLGGAIPSNELMRAEAFARRVSEPFSTRVRGEKEKERIKGYKK